MNLKEEKGFLHVNVCETSRFDGEKKNKIFVVVLIAKIISMRLFCFVSLFESGLDFARGCRLRVAADQSHPLRRETTRKEVRLG